MQFEKLLPFLEKCRKAKIHIAAETCGHVSEECIRNAADYIDMFLLDIKTLDKEKYRLYTGGDHDVYMRAVEALCKVAEGRIIARIPVIPGFNDTDICDILRFTADKDIKEVHLLPYHTLGMEKYTALGKEYELECKEALDAQTLEKYLPLGKELGITVRIGG
ncbi:MAG: radical SAM protein [Oscillospiraceae bacterium]|nr:radical SAM protein [Oscillospiraceae bacterium]